MVPAVAGRGMGDWSWLAAEVCASIRDTGTVFESGWPPHVETPVYLVHNVGRENGNPNDIEGHARQTLA